jgi:hypothetical protein
VSVWTASLVSVSVDDELRRGRLVKKQAVVNSSTEVADETLQGSVMWLPGPCI